MLATANLSNKFLIAQIYSVIFLWIYSLFRLFYCLLPLFLPVVFCGMPAVSVGLRICGRAVAALCVPACINDAFASIYILFNFLGFVYVCCFW